MLDLDSLESVSDKDARLGEGVGGGDAGPSGDGAPVSQLANAYHHAVEFTCNGVKLVGFCPLIRIGH